MSLHTKSLIMNSYDMAIKVVVHTEYQTIRCAK